MNEIDITNTNSLNNYFSEFTLLKNIPSFNKQLIQSLSAEKLEKAQKIINSIYSTKNTTSIMEINEYEKLQTLKSTMTIVKKNYYLLENNNFSKFYYLICGIFFKKQIEKEKSEVSIKLQGLDQLQQSIQKKIELLEKQRHQTYNSKQQEFYKQKGTFERKVLENFDGIVDVASYDRAIKQGNQFFLPFNFYQLLRFSEFNQFMDQFNTDYSQKKTYEQKIDCLKDYFYTKIKEQTFYEDLKLDLKDTDGKINLMILFLLKGHIDIDLEALSFGQEAQERNTTSAILENAVKFIINPIISPSKDKK